MSMPAYQPIPTDVRAALQEADDTASPETVSLRLAVLRADVPDVLVQLDSVRADDTAIAIKATIGRNGGGRASAIAAADVDEAGSWADQLANVEAVAIARALDQLGMTLERALQGSRQDKPQPQAPQAAPPQVAPASQSAQPPPSQATQPQSADEDHLPEFSWNAFWQHARTRGISKEQLEQALGRSVKEASPQQAVDALTSAGMWQD